MQPILAIDPGTNDSGVVLWDGIRVENPTICTNADLLPWVRGLDDDWVMAVEMIASYGMPVGKETFETCILIGRLQEIWGNRPFHFIFRKDVKIHLCGNTKAKDGNIRQALIDKLGEVGTKKNPGPLYGVSQHIWSALAVAVTCQETRL